MWRLASDTVTEDDVDALASWLRTHQRLTQGELVWEFERQWSAWLGVTDSVFVSSGTTANFALVATVARRLSRRPRVGVAAVTWSTNVTPSLLLGHEVVVFDVDRQTLGVDAQQVLAAIEHDEIDILFVTHLLGLDALTDEVLEAAHRHNVVVLEDCCEAHGARHGSDKVGTFGLGSTFSFYYGHHMSTIEGGMISTNEPELAEELRLMRGHGLARETTRYAAHSSAHPNHDARFLFVSAGLNFRSTEVNAFLGLRQLERLDERIGVRNRNMAHFLDTAPAWLWTDYRTDGMSSFALPLIARDQAAAAGVVEVVAKLDIESRPVVAGNLLRQPFAAEYGLRPYGGASPVADHIHECGLYVGNGHHVSIEMVDALTDSLAR